MIKLKNNLCCFLCCILPKRLVFYCAVRAVADATAKTDIDPKTVGAVAVLNKYQQDNNL